jgi:hypothetical protein
MSRRGADLGDGLMFAVPDDAARLVSGPPCVAGAASVQLGAQGACRTRRTFGKGVGGDGSPPGGNVSWRCRVGTVLGG